MFVNKSRGNLSILLLLSFFIIFALSVSAYTSETFFDKTELCIICDVSNIVILTASDGAMGFGHTTLLIESEGSWFYFSWQLYKVVFSEVPSYAMTSLSSFNYWISEEESFQNYKNEFDSAILINGDFSGSLVKARSIFEDYLHEQGLNISDFDSSNISLLDKNFDYHVLFNNCVEFSYVVLSYGFVNCDIPFSDVVERPSLISNVARLQFEAELDFEEFSWIN